MARQVVYVPLQPADTVQRVDRAGQNENPQRVNPIGVRSGRAARWWLPAVPCRGRGAAAHRSSSCLQLSICPIMRGTAGLINAIAPRVPVDVTKHESYQPPPVRCPRPVHHRNVGAVVPLQQPPATTEVDAGPVPCDAGPGADIRRHAAAARTAPRPASRPPACRTSARHGAEPPRPAAREVLHHVSASPHACPTHRRFARARPVCPWTTMSLVPPVSIAAIGQPSALASRSTRLNGSRQWDGNTNSSACRIQANVSACGRQPRTRISRPDRRPAASMPRTRRAVAHHDER